MWKIFWLCPSDLLLLLVATRLEQQWRPRHHAVRHTVCSPDARTSLQGDHPWPATPHGPREQYKCWSSPYSKTAWLVISVGLSWIIWITHSINKDSKVQKLHDLLWTPNTFGQVGEGLVRFGWFHLWAKSLYTMFSMLNRALTQRFVGLNWSGGSVKGTPKWPVPQTCGSFSRVFLAMTTSKRGQLTGVMYHRADQSQGDDDLFCEKGTCAMRHTPHMHMDTYFPIP